MKRKPPLSLVFKRTTSDTPTTPHSESSPRMNGEELVLGMSPLLQNKHGIALPSSMSHVFNDQNSWSSSSSSSSSTTKTVRPQNSNKRRRSSFITEVLLDEEGLLGNEDGMEGLDPDETIGKPSDGNKPSNLAPQKDFIISRSPRKMEAKRLLPRLGEKDGEPVHQEPLPKDRRTSPLIERIKRQNTVSSEKRPKSKFSALHRKHRLKNAFPTELTGGYYNLRYQSLTGNFEKVDDIFQYFTKEATPDSVLVSNGLSSLHSACLAEQIKVVDYLLIEEADVELESHSGTPLQIAVIRRNASLMQMLLDKGKADCNKRCTTHVEDWNADDWYAQLDAAREIFLSDPVCEGQHDTKTRSPVKLNRSRRDSPTRAIATPSPTFRNTSRIVPGNRIVLPPAIQSLNIKKRKSRNSSRKKKKISTKVTKKRYHVAIRLNHYLQQEHQLEEHHLHSKLAHREKVPLAICIDLNFVDGVKVLLQQKSLLVENGPHIEALNRCIYMDRVEIAAILLNEYHKRFTQEIFLRYHEVALRKAIALNKPKMVEQFLKHTNRMRSSVFADLMVETVKTQNMELLEEILKRDGHTKAYIRKLLHTATQLNLPLCCDLLLKYKVPVETKNIHGFTALHIATENNLLSVVPVLLSYHANTEALAPDSGFTPLHLAVSRQKHDVARILLKHDAFIDCRGALNNKTPLHLATELDDIKMVELLLQYSPNLETTSDIVPPVLHTACLKGFVELVCIFLETGAQVDSRYRAGTPLHNLIFAWRSVPNCSEIAKKLIAFRADIEAKSATQLSPLQLAVKQECVEVIEILVKLKADVHVLYPNNDSLVHMAARLGSLETLKHLLLLGVWPDRNSHGKTPLDVIPFGHPHAEACRQLLMQYWKVYGYIYRNPSAVAEHHSKAQEEQFNSQDWDHVMSRLKRRLSGALTLGRRSSIPWKLKD